MWSKSINILIAGLLVLLDWFLSNHMTMHYGSQGIFVISLFNCIFLITFIALYYIKSFNGRSIYRTMAVFYGLYVAVNISNSLLDNLWPQAFAISNFSVFLMQNIIFICVILALIIYSFIKGIHNRIEGDADEVYDLMRSRFLSITHVPLSIFGAVINRTKLLFGAKSEKSQ